MELPQELLLTPSPPPTVKGFSSLSCCRPSAVPGSSLQPPGDANCRAPCNSCVIPLSAICENSTVSDEPVRWLNSETGFRIKQPLRSFTCASIAMGVLGRRKRADSQATHPPHISNDSPAPGTIGELPEPSSFPPRTIGSEPVLSGGTSYRTPSRSFYHRSFHNTSGK